MKKQTKPSKALKKVKGSNTPKKMVKAIKPQAEKLKTKELIQSEVDFLKTYLKRHKNDKFGTRDISILYRIHSRITGLNPKVNEKNKLEEMNKIVDNLKDAL